MSNQNLQSESQDFLDPENRETLLKFLKGHNLNVNEEMIDVVNRMAPLRVMEKVLGDDALSQQAKGFFEKIEATNNGAKPGENFEDFLWRYIESDDIPAIAEEELEGLAEVYEKVSGIESQDSFEKEFDQPEIEQEKEVPDTKTGGIKLQVKAHPDDANKSSQIENGEEEAGKVEEKTNLKETIKKSQVDLVKKLGIDKLPQAEQEKAILQMGEVIQQRILIRIAEEFPEDKKDELLKLMQDKETTPEKFNEFVAQNLPNVEEIVSSEVESYKKESLDFAKDVLGEK
jgi:hypothetical protein